MRHPVLSILRASAGSGKTYQLSLRYIKLLLFHKDLNINNILAITFTNKAANEMRSRILEFLKKISLDFEAEDIFKNLGVKDKFFIKKRASQILDYIINNYSEFHVKTIDSFVNSLIVASSLHLKIAPYTQIMQDSQQYLEYIVDRILEEIPFNPSLSRLIDTFLNYYMSVEEKTSWRPKIDILKIIQELHFKENIHFKEFKINQSESLERLREDIQNKMRDVAFIDRKIKEVILKDLKNREFLEKVLNVFNKYQSQISPDLKKSIAKFTEVYSSERFKAYIMLFRECQKLLDAFKRSRKIIFLEELNKQAWQLFRKGEEFLPEIYYRFATVFYHYLIDEFQDTSHLQWDNIFPLIEEALSCGGSLFYVGDRKQAIYRFRGGEVELFEKVKKIFKDRVYIEEDILNINRRSAQVIVELNNRAFSSENIRNFLKDLRVPIKGEDIDKILHVFKDSSQKCFRKEKGYIYLEIIDNTTKEDYWEKLTQYLYQLFEDFKKRVNYNDIGILTRSNDEAIKISDLLIERNVPVESEKTLSLKENSLIREIIDFLKFLVYPRSDLCFLGFVCGQIFCKATNLEASEILKWTWNHKHSGPLYLKFKQTWPQIYKEFLEPFLEEVQIVPCYELINLIFKKYRVLSNFSYNEAFFMRLLEIVYIQQEQFYLDTVKFLEWYENASYEDLSLKLPVLGKGVKVMTIHKAKGLEFKIVVLPMVNFDITTRFRGRIFFEDQEQLWLLNINKSMLSVSSKLKDIYTQELYRSILDELNTLYVAFTRARDELYAFFPRRFLRRKNPFINLFFPEEKRIIEKGCKISAHKEEIKIKREDEILDNHFEEVKIHFQSQTTSFKEVIDNFTHRAIYRGEVAHKILSLIKSIPSVFPWDHFLENLSKSVCFVYGYKDWEKIYDLLIKNFSNAQFRKFFQTEGKIFTEKELVDSKGDIKRVDRLIFKDEEIILIDFKTGSPSSEDITQIKEYSQILKEIFPDKKIKVYLSYLKDCQIKEV